MTSQKTMALMRTEYMDMFLPPVSYKMIVRTKEKHPYHALKGTSVDTTTYTRFYLAQKWVKNQPKPPQPLLQPKGQQRTCTAGHCREPFKQADKHQSRALRDSPKVKQQPFESTTTYKADFVFHPLQPRARIQKPATHSNRDLLSEPTEGHKTHRSTAQTDFPAHKCQRIKPIVPITQHNEKSTEPMQATTTMGEDFKAWKVQRRRPFIPKQDLDWLKKPKSPKDKQTTPSLRPEPRVTVSCNITHSLHTPTETEVITGFECFCNGEESKTLWTSSVGRGVTQDGGEVCEKPRENQQIVSCMVSRKTYQLPKTRTNKKCGTSAPARVVSAFNTNKSQK